MTNSFKQGKIRVLVFRERGVWYGAALELNIVESGDDPREVLLMLDEAIRGYIRSAQKTKNVSLLNQKPDSEYEKLWSNVQVNKPIPSPIQVYSANAMMISSL